MGSEYLKTIVPMSGLIGVQDLMWRNGSMEARGAIMHNGCTVVLDWMETRRYRKCM